MISIKRIERLQNKLRPSYMSLELSKRKARFTETMQKWGSINRRIFPWRRTRNPYQVFVAEILLQRTRADQAESTYAKFLQKWSDITALSNAKIDEVRSTIRSLGLEYRAKRLQKLSREIVQNFGPKIPDNLSELHRLYGKGFGDYMAHAILCFAYGKDVPVVDRNVERILERVFSLQTKGGHRDPRLWQFAAELIPRGKAREYNWSLIDFGALVCSPRNPKCRICPIMEICDFGGKRAGD